MDDVALNIDCAGMINGEIVTVQGEGTGSVDRGTLAMSLEFCETAALYMACGLDPERSTIFRPSAVTAHAVLGWILDRVTPVGWLERMTQVQVQVRELQRERGSTHLPLSPSG